jgi:hypothetical protein
MENIGNSAYWKNTAILFLLLLPRRRESGKQKNKRAKRTFDSRHNIPDGG